MVVKLRQASSISGFCSVSSSRSSYRLCKRIGLLCVFALITLVYLDVDIAVPLRFSGVQPQQRFKVSSFDTFKEEWYVIPPNADNLIQSKVQAAVNVPNNISASPLHNCSVTNQVALEINATGHWLLHAYHDGMPKTVGGDDFYITFQDYSDPNFIEEFVSPTGVAKIIYLGNGAYHLEFVEPPTRRAIPISDQPYRSFQPSGKGRVTVYFVYTCFIGSWDPASKVVWHNSGASRAVYFQENVTSPRFLQPFQLPTLLNPGHGAVDFGNYHTVVCYGDSVGRNFCGGSAIDHDCPVLFHKANVIVFPHTAMPVSSTTTTKFMSKFEGACTRYNTSLLKDTSTALILGSSAWDILLFDQKGAYPRFDDHIAALRTILLKIKQDHPTISLYWKSPQALHVHALQESCYRDIRCVGRCRFMSNHYVREIHERQISLMKELEIPVIDVFEISLLSAELHRDGDGVHYRNEFNWALFNLTYPKDYPEVDVCERMR